MEVTYYARQWQRFVDTVKAVKSYKLSSLFHRVTGDTRVKLNLFTDFAEEQTIFSEDNVISSYSHGVILHPYKIVHVDVSIIVNITLSKTIFSFDWIIGVHLSFQEDQVIPLSIKREAVHALNMHGKSN